MVLSYPPRDELYDGVWRIRMFVSHSLECLLKAIKHFYSFIAFHKQSINYTQSMTVIAKKPSTSVIVCIYGDQHTFIILFHFP